MLSHAAGRRGGGAIAPVYRVRFNGSSQYATWAGFPSVPFSLMCRLLGGNNTSNDRIMTAGGGGSDVQIYAPSGLVGGFSVRANGSGTILHPQNGDGNAPMLIRDRWNTLVLTQANSSTISNTNTKINNLACGTGSTDTITTSGSPNAGFNWDGSAASTFNGYICEMALWSRQLSAAEVALLQNGSFDLRKNIGAYSASSLWSWWRFLAGSGSTVVDSSGNGRTLTLVGSPTWSALS